ncbi:MAG: hypothetical protein IIB13_07050 [Chloroflexi bacterium]|nr:hypothetical protein [Chloroflexota bacterium]
MKDKSMEVFLVVLFGILGLAIIVLAWVRPMPDSERILTTLIGSIGLLLALGQGLFLKTNRQETEVEYVLVRTKEKP